MEQNDSEVAVLGACIIEPECIGEIADYLTPADFYNESHSEIYASMLNLWREGTPVSEATLTSDLTSRRKLTLAGGAAYLSHLTLILPDVANIEYYARQVKENSLLRTVKSIGVRLSHTEGDPHDALNNALEVLSDASTRSLRSVPQSLGEYTEKVVEWAIAIAEGRGKKNTLLTGMEYLDAITGGFSPADLIIIGAQPSVGKSAIALWIAKQVAENAEPVLFISLEMSANQIATRMLAAETGIKYTRIQDGELSGIAIDEIRDGNRKLKMLPFTVDDRAGQSISDIRVKARREKFRNGLSLLIVDYLQIACKDPTDVGLVAQVSTGLKNIAKDLNIPVIALSQFSRNIEHRDTKKPQLTDLKQSSQIEQDADLVFLMYVPDRRKRDELMLFAAKHRNGPLGEVLLHFDKDCQRFNELEGRVG